MSSNLTPSAILLPRYTLSMRFPIVLTLLVLCAACSPDEKDAVLKRCIDTSTRNNPGDATESQEERHDAIGADVASCMKVAGYRHDMADGKCVDDVDFNRYCYVRRRG